MTDATTLARASIARHSKSFSLASKLLPADRRDTARVVYAWCRRADDAVDLAPAEQCGVASAELLRELDELYDGRVAEEPIVAAFGEVVGRYDIPKAYPHELLLGMRMDAEQKRYETWDDLLLYCYRVAGTVGLMMCHVLGVKDARALRNAAHLGMAMQLTNIARDVAEDWQRQRLYLPDELLRSLGAPGLASHLGGELPEAALPALARGVRRLLEHADAYYRSADAGLEALDRRSAWAVGTARLVYSDIGRELARKSYAVDAGRAHVLAWRKVYLAVCAGARVLRSAAWASELHTVRLDTPLRFPDDIVLV